MRQSPTRGNFCYLFRRRRPTFFRLYRSARPLWSRILILSPRPSRHRQPFYAQASPRRPPHIHTPGHSASPFFRPHTLPPILALRHRVPAKPTAASVHSLRTPINCTLLKTAMFWRQRGRSRTPDGARSLLQPALGHDQGGEEENIDQQSVYRSRGGRARECWI